MHGREITSSDNIVVYVDVLVDFHPGHDDSGVPAAFVEGERGEAGRLHVWQCADTLFNLMIQCNVAGLKLGATTYNIVGVAPPEFFGTKVGEAPDMWVPLSMVKEVPPRFGGYKENFSESLLIMGRLKPGVSIDAATANVNVLFRQILRSFPDAKLTQENLQKLDMGSAFGARRCRSRDGLNWLRSG